MRSSRVLGSMMDPPSRNYETVLERELRMFEHRAEDYEREMTLLHEQGQDHQGPFRELMQRVGRVR